LPRQYVTLGNPLTVSEYRIFLKVKLSAIRLSWIKKDTNLKFSENFISRIHALQKTTQNDKIGLVEIQGRASIDSADGKSWSILT